MAVIGHSMALLSLVAVWLPATGSADVLAGIEGVYDLPASFPTDNSPVVLILDTQHPDKIRSEMKKPGGYSYMPKLKKMATELSGLRSLAVHYTQFGRADLKKLNVKAVILTARERRIDPSYDQELFALIRETAIPTIGFCGGHHLIAQAYGAKTGLMRPLRDGEKDTHPEYHPGQFKEWGFMPVKVVKRDPLFDGLPDPIVVREMHAFHLTDLPAEFDVLASTDECRIQAIKHRDKPLYGTQFHAEHYDDKHLDGKAVLRNFFRIAGLPARPR